ncbi:c-type cytochrome [Sphingomonas ginkgonis]|uniref:c-type cytochrome n=1 Tax=Sphingomonas ginkgonis TaxID=2315330 RepID=UPI001C8CC6DC|nr:c-type cytochrome [Sphingomonas ginkgonis]
MALIAAGAALIGAVASAWAISSRQQGIQQRIARTVGADPEAAGVPLGDVAGGRSVTYPEAMVNPLGDDPSAIAAGRKLYTRMNCAYCHGFKGEGGMGPALNDGYWRYGGTPVRIYKTLVEGRPQGMPAWGRSLPPRSLWQLTAYVSSLGGGISPEGYQRDLQGDFAARSPSKATPGTADGGFAIEGQ